MPEPPTTSNIIEAEERFRPKSIDLELANEDILADPYNIFFVRLPKTWTLKEVEEVYGSRLNNYIRSLVEQRTPFIPGIKPGCAWVNVFNSLDWRSGSGNLMEDDTHVYREATPIHFQNRGEVIKKWLEEKGIALEQTPENIVNLPTTLAILEAVNLPLSIKDTIEQAGHNDELVHNLLQIQASHQRDLPLEIISSKVQDLKDFLAMHSPKLTNLRSGRTLIGQTPKKMQNVWRMGLE